MNNKPKILIIDDEPDMLSACSMILTALELNPFPFSDCDKAIKSFSEEEYDLIICDLLMPKHDGMKILEISKKLAPHTPIIIFTAYGTIDRAVAAMKAGAFDFVQKPFDTELLQIVITKGLRQRELYKERFNLLKQLEDKYHFDNIIGKSEQMQNIFEMIENIAGTDVNVLITGESGTGKELIARSIHARSKRKTKPFVPVNCGAFPENLFEAEMFGYEKGAFTGAVGRKIGLLEFANSGTFFLDEVCELPVNLQIKLLRTLQDHQLRRVGGNDLIRADIRIISATNRNIMDAIENETLRKDFFYRINVLNIQIPPLRERKEDIQLLAEHFFQKILKSINKELKGFSEEVIEVFENYPWHGNVRELENVVERAIAIAKTDWITVNELPSNMLENYRGNSSHQQSTLSQQKQMASEEVEKKFLQNSLQKNNGNITKVAEEAFLSRRQIHRLIHVYNLDPNKFRKGNDE
ncbi:MAG: sigma-54 dependent transcriptional regulator [Ignavibacteria bacterium]|nr:sigma-54 dependent transcriptional regulator [Ignavibacteria bacterium]